MSKRLREVIEERRRREREAVREQAPGAWPETDDPGAWDDAADEVPDEDEEA